MKTRYLRLVKKQRGFTLIELLAVILILGIIALIAIPTVSSVVEQSRKGAAESSASQFVTSIGELIMTEDLSGNKLSDGLYTAEQLQDKGLNIKGTMPDDGYVLIEDGEVVGCNLNYGNFNVTCDGSDFNSSKTEETPKFTIVDDADSNGEVSLKDKVCIGTGEKKECFYVVGFDEDGNVRMLTEWNLNVGYDLTYNGSYELPDDADWTYDIDEKRGFYLKKFDIVKTSAKNNEIKQDKNTSGWSYNELTKMWMVKGIINFSDLSESNIDYEKFYNNNGYWVDSNKNILSKYGSSYPSYVYDDNVIFSKYIDNYVDNLKIKYGQNIISGNLIKLEELINLGCDGEEDYVCTTAESWIYQTDYWTGSATNYYVVRVVSHTGFFGNGISFSETEAGVRPVITISKSLF